MIRSRIVTPSAAAIAAALVVSAAAGGAWAFSIFLNGVNVDGVTNQQFRNVQIRIDARGDVYIDAPGYQVQRVDTPGGSIHGTSTPAVSTPATTAVGGTPSHRVWLVTDQAARGMTQYEIDVYLNGQFFRTLHSDEDQVILDVTQRVHAGRNTVLCVARKMIEGNRRSMSPSHYFRVVIGEGQENHGTVMIDRQLVLFTRTADETQAEVRQDFTLDVR